jgi:glycosyltransferase involved in cell wall biosynthesis
LNTKPQIAAVMVVYNQKVDETKTYKSFLYNCAFPILIYDNSPTSQEVTLPINFKYFHNPKNPGVSAAYNCAAHWAKENGSTHLLLLDSDSSFPVNAAELYLKAMEENGDKIILPTMKSENRKISPFYFKWGKTWYGDNIKEGVIKLGNILAINSGMLIPIKVFESVNGFNPDISLDFSDIDFVYRISKKYHSASHIPLLVNHGLSEHEEKPIESVKFRFGTYLQGLKRVSVEPATKPLMWYWAKLKALKLSLKHGTSYFFIQYLKSFFSAA